MTSGSSYCFSITPLSIPGINSSLGGFDFEATGDFTFGGKALASMLVGAAPDGRLSGRNNDYQIACQWCCPGQNLLKNGDFEEGNGNFSSQYIFNPAATAAATLPGQYSLRKIRNQPIVWYFAFKKALLR